MNKVILIGRLGKDPEIRQMQNGDRVVSFTLATSESWKDKATGERKEKTEWHNVVSFQQRFVNYAEKFEKGQKVYVEGQLSTRKYQNSAGQDVYKTEVVIGMNGHIMNLTEKSTTQTGSDDNAKAFKDGVAEHFDDEIPF